MSTGRAQSEHRDSTERAQREGEGQQQQQQQQQEEKQRFVGRLLEYGVPVAFRLFLGGNVQEVQSSHDVFRCGVPVQFRDS